MKSRKFSISILILFILAFSAVTANAQFGGLIKKAKEKAKQAGVSTESNADTNNNTTNTTNTSQPTEPRRDSNSRDDARPNNSQSIVSEPTAPAGDPPGPADGSSFGVRSGNARVVNGYEVPTNPNRVIFSKTPISPTNAAARQTTVRHFYAGEPIYALARMKDELNPTSSWSVAMFVDDKRIVFEYLDERSRGNVADHVVPIEIVPATPADTKNAFISYLLVSALNSYSPGVHKVWIRVGVPRSSIEQSNVSEGIFYLDNRKGSYATQLAALKKAAAPEVERRRGIDETAAREARESSSRPSSHALNNSNNGGLAAGMPPPGFEPNVRIHNSCGDQRHLYFETGENPTLNDHSTMDKRLKPGTKIYLIDDSSGNKSHIYTVTPKEDQEMKICG